MTRPRRVLVTPRDPNPYQQLLYGALEARGWDVHYCDGPSASQTVNVLAKPFMLAWHRARGFRLLHVHWIYDFSVPWARSSDIAKWLLHIWFRAYLLVARALGIRIVWTAHNLIPHDKVFADDRGARRTLVGEAQAVIALSAASVVELASIGAQDVRVIPFGAYGNGHNTPEVSSAARCALGLRHDDFVVVFVGRVERYKGVLDLIAAIPRIDTRRRVRVLVGGECRDADLRSELEAAVGDETCCRLRLDWLSDSDLENYLHAADVAVFPFHAVTNSSSVVLALCHGVPVVVPSLQSLSDIPRSCGIWYDGSDTDGLANALGRAAHLTDQQTLMMRSSALHYCASLDWDVVGIATERVYEEVLNR